MKEALDQYASVFLLSPVVVVRGILLRKGARASLLVEKALTLLTSCSPKVIMAIQAACARARCGR